VTWDSPQETHGRIVTYKVGLWPFAMSPLADEVVKWRGFLAARRCASAGTSYGPVSVCVCLSVRSLSCIETAAAVARSSSGGVYTLCPKKVSPLNILQQPPQTCTDLNEILHTQDDIYFCHRRQI